jgi:hypothetical protein
LIEQVGRYRRASGLSVTARRLGTGSLVWWSVASQCVELLVYVHCGVLLVVLPYQEDIDNIC